MGCIAKLSASAKSGESATLFSENGRTKATRKGRSETRARLRLRGGHTHARPSSQSIVLCVSNTHPYSRQRKGKCDEEIALDALSELATSLRAYCLSATNWLVVLCNLSVLAMVMLLPSGEMVITLIEMTLPSRLSVSSILFLLVRLSDTLLMPGSP